MAISSYQAEILKNRVLLEANNLFKLNILEKTYPYLRIPSGEAETISYLEKCGLNISTQMLNNVYK